MLYHRRESFSLIGHTIYWGVRKMCRDIGSIYKSIFDKELIKTDISDQICTQKVVYLIENMGIHIGDYNYVWSKHGPYSCDLQRDILETKESKTIDYSDAMKNAIEKIKTFLSQKGDFSNRDFLELIVSLHYVKEYENDGFCTDDQAIDIVMMRKPHLNDYERNKIVMDKIVNTMFA